MISAILGHSIKSEKADKLRSEVEKFLDGNREEKEYGKPAVRFNTSEKYIRGVSKNSTNTRNKEERIKKQMPVLVEYMNYKNSKSCWTELSNAIGGMITASHLNRCARGKTSIINIDVWKNIENKINELMGVS